MHTLGAYARAPLQRPGIFGQSTAAAAVLLLQLFLLSHNLAAARQTAQCYLMLKQQGSTAAKDAASSRPGLMLSLNCTSDSPVVVGVNSSLINGASGNLRVSGVETNSNVGCQPTSGLIGQPLSAVLYFCGDYLVDLINPVVEGVTLNSNTTAILSFGNNVTAAITGGRFDGNRGGPILLAMQHAALTVQNSVFNSNAAYAGSAVLAADATHVVLSNSTIAGNVAIAPLDTGGCSGGAVLSLGSANITVQDSRFANNRAAYGGAVGVLQNSSMRITRSSFTGNRGGRAGGALCAGNTSKVVVEGSTFELNSATVGRSDGSGGVALLYGEALVSARASTFKSNTAGMWGGVFRVANSSVLSVAGCNFTNNTALGESGGVLDIGHNAEVLIADSTMESNSCGKWGAAVFADTNSTILIKNTTFMNNRANISGGALFAADLAQVTMVDTTMQQNRADYAGAVFSDWSSRILISGSELTSNMAETSGGAISTAKNSSITLQDSIISGNIATSGGGGVIIQANSSVVVNGCVVVNNGADYGGAVDVLDAGMVSIISSDLSSNWASTSGGAVFAQGNSSVSMTGTKLWNNSAAGYGGGADFIESSKAFIADSQFKNNTANYGGGVVCDSNSTTHIRNSTLVYNSADLQGGGVYIATFARVTMIDCAVVDNTADDRGGGLRVQDNSTVLVSGSLLAGNEAATHGGGLDAVGNSTVKLHDSRLLDSQCGNAEGGWGGGIYGGEQTVLTIQRTTLAHNNAATSGGFMFLSDNGTALVVDSNITENSAQFGGGAFTERNASFRVVGCLISGNAAKEDAGAIKVFNGTFSMANSTLHNNKGDNGGAVMTDNNSTMTIERCIFDGNSGSYGGALYHKGSSRSFVHDVILYNNDASANGGGCLAQSFSQVSFNQTYFINNTAANYGGSADFSESVQVTFEETGWVNNTATYGAAFVCSGVADISVENSTFTSNNALEKGGAVYASAEATVLISHSTALDNRAGQFGGVVYFQDNSTVTTEQSVYRDNFAGRSGGVVFTSGDAKAIFLETILESNTANTGSGGSCFGEMNSSLMLSNTQMTLNSAWEGSGGAVAAAGGTKVLLNNSLCANNSAANGGCLGADTSTVVSLFGSTTVRHNTAYRGGGLQLFDNSTLHVTPEAQIVYNKALRYLNSRPDGDTGGVAGGVFLYTKNFDPTLLQAVVHNNTAPYRSDIGVSVQRIQVIGNTTVDNFASRLGTDEGLLDVLLNVSGHYGIPCEALQLQAVLNESQMLGINKSDSSGLVCMHVKVQKPPGVYVVEFSAPEATEVPPANVTLNVRSCIQGEVMPSSDACLQCPVGYFSLEPTNKTCDVCPPGADCSGSTVIPMLGLWTSSASSNQIHRCPNPLACQGNRTAVKACAEDLMCRPTSQYSDLQCSPQYHGNLCGMCTSGYGPAKPFSCRPCFRKEVIVGLYAAAAVAMLFVIKLLCHFTKAANRGTGLSGPDDQLLPADLFKPLLLYFQWQLVVVGSMGVDWRAPLNWAVTVLGWAWSPVSPETLSIQCLLPDSPGFPVAFRAQLIYLCIPVAMLVLSLLLDVFKWLVSHFHQHRSMVVSRVVESLLANAMVAWFFFLPSILRTIFSMFACIPIDRPAAPPFTAAAVGSYWTSDTSIKCFTSPHKAWALGLGLPLIVIVCVGIPVFILYKTLHNRHRLGDADFRLHWGFLTRSFQPRYCYFEAVIVVETTLLVAIGVFGVNLGRYYQSIVLNFCLIVVALLLARLRPYAQKAVNEVALHGACCILLTTNVSMSLLPSSDGISPGTVYTTVIGVILVVVNIAFIVSAVWRLIRVVDWGQVQQSMRLTWTNRACFDFCGSCQADQHQQLQDAAHPTSAAALMKDLHDAAVGVRGYNGQGKRRGPPSESV